jgi:hypothetical protein
MVRQLPSSFPSVPLPIQPRNRRRPHGPTVTVFIPERAFTYAGAQSSEAPWWSDSYRLRWFPSVVPLPMQPRNHRRPHAPTVTVFIPERAFTYATGAKLPCWVPTCLRIWQITPIAHIMSLTEGLLDLAWNKKDLSEVRCLGNSLLVKRAQCD